MSFKTVSLCLVAMLGIVFVVISIISDDIQTVEGKKEDGGKKNKKSKERPEPDRLMETMDRMEPPLSYMNEFSHDEIHVGGKRFKLYEKKHLTYKKAKSFCKKKDGKLAEAMNLDEMRRLQMLLMRARTIGDDMWVGADKKEWKKHSLKMQRKPNFGPDPALFGGGPTEMCPALSVSTRSLSPVMCTKEMAFICEFEEGKGKSTKPKQGQSKTAKPTKPESKGSNASRGNNEKSKTAQKTVRNKNKVEMKRRKRQVETPTLVSPTPSETISSDDNDNDDDVMETTEAYVTENSVVAAAAHNIGFAPHVVNAHVEHLLVEQENSGVTESTSEMYNNEAMEKLATIQSEKVDSEHAPKAIHHQVKLSTKIIIDDIDNNLLKSPSSISTTKSTTTLDPDQMLMDMNDEQTMNLTAIELEAEAASAASIISILPTTKQHSIDSTESSPEFSSGKSQKMSEYMEDNDLSLDSSSATLVVSATTDETVESSKLKSSNVNMTLSSSSKLEDEMEDGNVTNEILSISEMYNSTDTTNEASVLPLSTTTPIIVSIDDVEGDNKRPIRNASYAQSVPVMNETILDKEQQQSSYNNTVETSSHSPSDNVEYVASTVTTEESTNDTNMSSSTPLLPRQVQFLSNDTVTEDFESSNFNFSAATTAKEHSVTLSSYETTVSSEETTHKSNITANSIV